MSNVATLNTTDAKPQTDEERREVLRQRMEAADRGEFASDQQVENLFATLGD